MAKFTGSAVGAEDSTARELLPARAARGMPKFKLAVNPNSWKWSDELQKFVPELLKIPLDPGVQNTSVLHANGQAHVNTSRCENDFTQKGHIVLNYKDARLRDVLPEGYLMRWDTQGKRQTYSCAWEAPTVFMGNVTWEVDSDLLEAVQTAIADRILPEMDPRIAAMHLGRVVRRMSRIKRADHPLMGLLISRRDGMTAFLQASGDAQALKLVDRYIRRSTRDAQIEEAAKERKPRRSRGSKGGEQQAE